MQEMKPDLVLRDSRKTIESQTKWTLESILGGRKPQEWTLTTTKESPKMAYHQLVDIWLACPPISNVGRSLFHMWAHRSESLASGKHFQVGCVDHYSVVEEIIGNSQKCIVTVAREEEKRKKNVVMLVCVSDEVASHEWLRRR